MNPILQAFMSWLPFLFVLGVAMMFLRVMKTRSTLFTAKADEFLEDYKKTVAQGKEMNRLLAQIAEKLEKKT
jgi:hypothetical protein